MPVFAVLAHDDPAMLLRLVRRLAPHPVVVHVDARHPQALGSDALRRQEHVRFVEDRTTANWGGWSQVEATMRLYRAIVPTVPATEQIVLLSGHCYPLRPVDELVATLGADPERPLFVEAVAYREVQDRTRTRLVHPYDVFPVRQTGVRRVVSAPPRKAWQALARRFPRSALVIEDELYLSSRWVVLTAGCVTEVLEPALERLRGPLRHTFAPEEVFAATAVMNSPARAATQTGGPVPYRGEWVSDYPNVHVLDPLMVRTFTELDWPTVAGGDALFVRKVSSDRSAALLDRIDRELLWR